MATTSSSARTRRGRQEKSTSLLQVRLLRSSEWRSQSATPINLPVLKSILALAATSALLGGSAILYRRRGSMGSVLQFLGVACFVVVALTHVFEAFAILPSLGWGQPRSIGHYIDLGAAILGLTLLFAGLLFQYLQRGSHVKQVPRCSDLAGPSRPARP